MIDTFFSSLDRSSIESAMVMSVVLMMAWEGWRPFRNTPPATTAHALNNLALTALNHGLLLVITPWLYAACQALLGGEGTGLLARLETGFGASLALTLLSAELASYWLHRAFHAVPWLWRIHTVHHADTTPDVTTAHRHHPLEVILGSTVTLLVLLTLAPDTGVVMAYSLLHIAISAFSHSNIRLPAALSQVLGCVLVTPNLHRLHHTADIRYTNSNYGAVLPLFDQLFGTRQHLCDADAQRLRCGLEYFRQANDGRLDQLLRLPWRRDLKPSPGPTPGPQ